MDVDTEWYSFHFHRKATPTSTLQTIPTCLPSRMACPKSNPPQHICWVSYLTPQHQVLGSIPGLVGRTLMIRRILNFWFLHCMQFLKHVTGSFYQLQVSAPFLLLQPCHFFRKTVHLQCFFRSWIGSTTTARAAKLTLWESKTLLLWLKQIIQRLLLN